MDLYGKLKGTNLIRLLRHLLKAGALKVREGDGKFTADFQITWDAPWNYAKVDKRMNCFLWKDITFHSIIEKQLPREYQWVPFACQDCYKVVVRPKTVKQLFALERLQLRLNRPSKCGTEERETVFGNYGGYFYNRGKAEGLECYRQVREEIDKDPELGPDVKVILKRGCTEYELALGRSDQWKPPTPDQLSFEFNLHQNFATDRPLQLQPDIVKDEIHQRWLEYAYKIGDETVLEFNDGKPFYPDYITYHQEAYQEEEEYVETGERGGQTNDSSSSGEGIGDIDPEKIESDSPEIA